MPEGAEMRDDAVGSDDVVEMEEAPGGEAACWAHLVCLECGALTTEGHRVGCSGAEESGRSGEHGLGPAPP